MIIFNSKNFFCPLLLACLSLNIQITAQEAGFDFSDEEVTESDPDAQRAIMSLISDGIKYEAACHQAYADVLAIISRCCKEIPIDRDYTECTGAPCADAIHAENLALLMSRHPYSTSAGQFSDGVLSRTTLEKAKPNLTSEQYTRIDHMITRSEMLMRWFIGPFRSACTVHHYDYYKDVQRVARFLVYTETRDFQVADKAYKELSSFFDGSVIPDRIMTAMNSFDYNQRQAYVFSNYFHNRISDKEREAWICYIVLGSSLRYIYDGPILNLGKEVNLASGSPVRLFIDIRGKTPSFAYSEPGAELSCYMRHFDTWTPARMNALSDTAEEAYEQVNTAATHHLFAKLEAVAEDLVVKEDSIFKELVTYTIPNALAAMMLMDEYMLSFEKTLKEETSFVANREKEKNTPLFALISKHIARAESALSTLKAKADRIVPNTDPSRQKD